MDYAIRSLLTCNTNFLLMKLPFCFLLISFNLTVFAQKPAIDTGALHSWDSIGEHDISPDGSYIWYSIVKESFQSNELIIRSIDGSWQRDFKGAASPLFAADGKHFIFKLGKDSLCILRLGSSNKRVIPNVSNYKLSNANGDFWLAYQLNIPSREIILCDLSTGREFHLGEGNVFEFAGKCKELLINSDSTSGDKSIPVVKLIDLETMNSRLIWMGTKTGEAVKSISFNRTGSQLAFIVEENSTNGIKNNLWYFGSNMDSATMLADDALIEAKFNLSIGNYPVEFTEKGDGIFFKIQSEMRRKPMPGAVMVDIWGYEDSELQSVQAREANYIPAYTCVFNLANRQLYRIEQSNERMLSNHGDYALVIQTMSPGGFFESFWNPKTQVTYTLESLKDGSRKRIRDHVTVNGNIMELSPEGKWLVYFDLHQNNYFSYETSTGITTNITKRIITTWTKMDAELPDPFIVRDMRWLPNDYALLVKDNYDIWQLDPAGVHKPLDITAGYGVKRGIQFDFLDNGNTVRVFDGENSGNILRARNTVSQDMGFYKVKLGVSRIPEYLTMGPYVYGFWSGGLAPISAPKSSLDGKVHLVIRMNVEHAPNCYITKDFRNFTAMSDIKPQRNFNWMSDKLIHFKTPDGKTSAGILYMPENFDSTKKYPVIFHFYEQKSDELRLYIRPDVSTGGINIPWFVSHDYIVCVPDIHYKIGEPGPSACDAVISAAEFLSKKRWVDSKRMGIQGHSFGGYEVNFIVTHSHLFSAACAVSAASDLISLYGSAAGGGFSQYHEEHGQGRMGGAPWAIAQLYVKNSPVFSAENVSTPILLVSNKGDTQVPFGQGVEFFTALRRLGKKAWMLQYDGSGHIIYPGQAMDFTIRMTQFFNHYLKGAAAPKWMVEGIPANMKGVENGLQLDTTMRTPSRY